MTTNPMMLGRRIRHDPRSRLYALPKAVTVESVSWPRHIPILDQGETGSCTGNALTGALGSGPLFDALIAGQVDLTLDENFARSVYSDAEKLDGGAGLPTEDQGSSGTSVAQVAKARGYISGFEHAFSMNAVHAAIQAGPFIMGIDWLSTFDKPDSNGVVKLGGNSRGGHEVLCRSYDAGRDLWGCDNSWGTSWGVSGSFFMSTATLSWLLGNQGDVTSLVPISQPAPQPTPAPTADALATFKKNITPWAVSHHTGANKTAAQNVLTYLAST